MKLENIRPNEIPQLWTNKCHEFSLVCDPSFIFLEFFLHLREGLCKSGSFKRHREVKEKCVKELGDTRIHYMKKKEWNVEG